MIYVNPSGFKMKSAVIFRDVNAPVNHVRGLFPTSELRSHLPIPGTFPVSVYYQISQGYAGLLPLYRGIHTKSQFTLAIPNGAYI